jgi:hypothetical protein
MIDEVSHAVQSECWQFNTEKDYPFTPDGDGNIVIPDNVLTIDVHNIYNKDPIIRDGRLYDKVDHTYEWDEAIEADVVWFFDFEDLPEVFKQYITIRAANLYAGRAVGSVEAVKYSEREEGNARAACIEYETRQGDYNFLGNSDGWAPVTYMPFNAIRR